MICKDLGTLYFISVHHTITLWSSSVRSMYIARSQALGGSGCAQITGEHFSENGRVKSPVVHPTYLVFDARRDHR